MDSQDLLLLSQLAKQLATLHVIDNELHQDMTDVEQLVQIDLGELRATIAPKARQYAESKAEGLSIQSNLVMASQIEVDFHNVFFKASVKLEEKGFFGSAWHKRYMVVGATKLFIYFKGFETKPQDILPFETLLIRKDERNGILEVKSKGNQLYRFEAIDNPEDHGETAEHRVNFELFHAWLLNRSLATSYSTSCTLHGDRPDQRLLRHLTHNLREKTPIALHVDDNALSLTAAGLLSDILTKSRDDWPIARSIHTLSITNSALKRAHLICFVEGFRGNSHLTKLILDDNDFSADLSDTLFESLHTCTRLEEISLRNCRLQDVNCVSLARYLAVPSLPLRSLDLSYNLISGNGIAILKNSVLAYYNAQPVPAWTLTALNLNNNLIGSVGLSELAVLLDKPWCQLRILSLKANHITSTGLRAFATAVRQNSGLVELDLTENPLNDQGLDALYQALQVNQSVKKTQFDVEVCLQETAHTALRLVSLTDTVSVE
eukprot:TRINITY_DN11806_c0_g1_i4.p1 TRINITY_DN11806_c0_g1~~TRINITY_DN11806_c0_g1_i4.p1  ORF type:complete len:491 (-),score=36.61 TRINITY_DN11806_c0_g1_i4:90-1562(-)